MISHGSEPKQQRGRGDKQRAETRLLGFFEDMVLDETPDAGLLAFAKHAGIALPKDGDADRLWTAFLAHYLTGTNSNSRVDETRFAHDLESFGPVARRIAELRRGPA